MNRGGKIGIVCILSIFLKNRIKFGVGRNKPEKEGNVSVWECMPSRLL